MNKLHPNEKKFEDHIEKYLNLIDFKSIEFNQYDRNLCLIKDKVLNKKSKDMKKIKVE